MQPTNSISRFGITCAVLAFSFVAATSAQANTITFTFDSMPYRSSSSPGSTADVATYLNSVWTAAGGSGVVTVSGAGELSNNQYTGDGHVVGPATCTHTDSSGTCRTWSVTPATLGSTNGGIQDSAIGHSLSATSADNYIVNSGSDRIVITFPTAITSISFDFEIFPDGTCASSTKCGSNQGNLPDFEFLAGSSLATLAPVFPTAFGTYPGAAGTYRHSPSSGGAGTEPAPQYLGTSGELSLGSGVTVLAFVDWPQRIGIDNLKIDPCLAGVACSSVPEPPTLPIVALGLGLIALLSRAASLRRIRSRC